METIYDYSYEKLEALFLNWGWKKFRVQQCFQWLYEKRCLNFNEMSDLSKETISKLEESFCIQPLKIHTKQVSKDKTVKYLFELLDGSLIETVLMHHDYGKSVCVTSQVGCDMGCQFCASGLLKKKRNLTAGEIVAQILFVQKELDQTQQRVSNVVIMGTGEPFDNYENVMTFCGIINHARGLALGARHITISTCGLTPMIDRFSKEHVQYNLAISLHASNDRLRSQLMPVNRAYPLKELMNSLRRYSQENNRRITFEYILLKGLNDQEIHAKELAKEIRGMNAYVNLIPYNAVEEHRFKSCDDKSALKFYDYLMKNGVKATLRARHGDDIDAACGQLRAKKERG
ncbi:MAG: 23S rRNA (adenine(2503)-C(2))-methyltransferase RlmN [Anaerorhabdus sp.]